MFNFLKEETKESSMRLFLFLGMCCIILLCLGLFTYVIIHAFKCTVIVDWAGMSLFLGAVSAFAGTLLYGKVQQKIVEKKYNNEKEEIK